MQQSVEHRVFNATRVYLLEARPHKERASPRLQQAGRETYNRQANPRWRVGPYHLHTIHPIRLPARE